MEPTDPEPCWECRAIALALELETRDGTVLVDQNGKRLALVSTAGRTLRVDGKECVT